MLTCPAVMAPAMAKAPIAFIGWMGIGVRKTKPAAMQAAPVQKRMLPASKPTICTMATMIGTKVPKSPSEPVASDRRNLPEIFRAVRGRAE